MEWQIPLELRQNFMFVAGLNLDGDMNQFLMFMKQLPVSFREFRLMSHNGNNGGKLAGADLPHMKVCDKGVTIAFHNSADFIG